MPEPNDITAPESSTPDDVAAGIARIEGYLLCQAALRRARDEGQAFADRMPWLTTAQHQEVARRFAEAHVEVTRTALRSVAARCEELKAEYTARYELLRRRLLCRTAALLLFAGVLYTATLLWIDATS
ncbi:hypothetical protein [Streptomyces sp. NPDC018031]|uniref:hypothetical protein n=1 Tax=Streptomyces sp. NPDC018031 TaxID=3365033 RepID=UPI0037961858